MKRIIYSILIFLTVVTIAGAESYYRNGEIIELQKIQEPRVLSADHTQKEIMFFRTQHGTKVGVTNEILVGCKNDVNCIELFERFNVSEFTKLTPEIYVVKVDDNRSVFTLSRQLYESGSVLFAHPNFIKKRVKR
ncbi:MAG: hypothetical protein L3J47_07340 [Sulfurovum sp.]|nr:hypothetical protein [Sulfurovum sp.]